MYITILFSSYLIPLIPFFAYAIYFPLHYIVLNFKNHILLFYKEIK
ncbi:hypothetical protein HMPREF3222_01428 [Clostridium perfringens]|uniref:Uncharacterized protein n=1 Tax=Clostridium perfringens TaxID=1502 RepID=A0A133N745_CLOPF|nr:hypothetical protein HMPREF3222_01428 [Clostridium perfringens]